jgi:hypothetical protein
LAKDEALGAPELPAKAHFTRDVVPEITILQRERKFDTPAWLWGAANIIVLLCSLGIVLGLCLTTSRISRGIEDAKNRGINLTLL